MRVEGNKFLEKIKRSIEEFNKYRSPEANAELLAANEEEISIRVNGSFCSTCGFYDYFDDLKIFLEENGIKVKRIGIEEKENGGIVKFRVTKIKR